MKNIFDFFNGFKKPTPIQKGDRCRNKITGVYSACLNVHGGLYYGRTENKLMDMGIVDNYERV